MGGIVAGWLNVCITMVLPLGFLVYLAIKRRGQLGPFFLGALAFTVSQLLVRIPLFRLLGRQPGFASFAESQPVLYAALLALSAGVLAVGANYLAMRFVMKKRRSLFDGIAYGAGHGGLEALIVGLSSLLYVTAYPFLLEAEGFGPVMVQGVERILAMAMQICLALLVLRAVREGKAAYLLLAMALHTLFLSVSVLSVLGWGDWMLEAALAVIVLATGVFTHKTRLALAGGGLEENKKDREKPSGKAGFGSLDDSDGMWD